jgi:hypothetical protein
MPTPFFTSFAKPQKEKTQADKGIWNLSHQGLTNKLKV